MDMEKIDRLIELRRMELNKLAAMYGTQDVRVIKKSVQLDHIMNIYIRNKESQQKLARPFDTYSNPKAHTRNTFRMNLVHY
ncbi:Spo0E family sporulation regulatory protein-aspartic acid phosphatase [Paenibacillus sp. CMAA1364]